MSLRPASYPRHRPPAEIISHAVWLEDEIAGPLPPLPLARSGAGSGVRCNQRAGVHAVSAMVGALWARQVRRRMAARFRFPAD